jgi:hypothetical protein
MLLHFTSANLTGFIPAIVAVAGLGGAWFHARYGRKVRVKVGPEGIEVEGQTLKQVEKLLTVAESMQQRSQKRIIHE